MKQQTLAMAVDQIAQYERYRRPTKRDAFLATVEQVVPWTELCHVIEPHYPKAGNGRPPVGLERMLRMYFVQHFAVHAGAVVDALISASGRVLLAFQDEETRRLCTEESVQRRPEQADPQIERTLASIRTAGCGSIPSVQVRGLYAVSFPILDAQGRAIAALAAHTLSTRIGGMVPANGLNPSGREEAQRRRERAG